MALSEFLSAVRVLIMDLDDLPQAEAERRLDYATLFPDLTTEEIEDLAAVPPEKLRTYTSTIFYGERAMLRNHFSCTVALLERRWEEVFGKPFELHRIIRDLHSNRPWKSYRTRVFAGNFVDYLTTDLAEFVKYEPALPEMAQLELLALDIKRAPFDKWSARDSLSRKHISELQVEALLNSHLSIPASAGLLECEFEVGGVYRKYYTSGKQLPEKIEREKTFIIGGRNRDLFARFEAIPEGVYRYLSGLPRTETIRVEELAAVFLESSSAEKSEEELFLNFLQHLLDLIDTGGVVLLPSSEHAAQLSANSE